MTREEAISSLKVWVERDKKILLQNDADRLENIEIYNMAIKALEQEPTLDKIKTEIDRQEKWLMRQRNTLCSIDIAFDAIRSVVAESGE